MSSLSDDLVTVVLERFGLDRVPAADRAGLDALYAAWCRSVPFDNAQKRISIAEEHDHLSGGTAPEFFRNYLAHGTGGMCWPTSNALLELARHLGFDARAAVCSMMYPARYPGHATILVRVDGEDLMADTSMLTGRVLPLRRGEPTAIDDTLHPMHAVPNGDLWIVWWANYARPDQIPCVFLEDRVSGDELTRRYEGTRTTELGFNIARVPDDLACPL
ncbi:MAG: hypothetical protein HY071_07100 [Chloroflexi bacterium]|nr:hypothetical protein [Chloroflexota bacterium]